jgi:hypothetical protein
MSETVTIEAFTSLERLENLRKRWNNLSCHIETDMDFFLQVVAARPEFIAPCVLLATCGENRAALLVGRLEKITLRPRPGYPQLPALPAKQLVFACHGSERFTLPVATALARDILTRLASHEAEIARMSNCTCGSALHASLLRLPNIFMRDFFPKVFAHWRLRLPESYDAFLQAMTGKNRHRLKSTVKQFEKTFGADGRYRIFTGPGETEQFFAAAEHIATKSWQRNLGKGFLNNDEQRRRIVAGAGNGWWRAYVLYIKEQPVAFWSGEYYKNNLHLMYTAYDHAYRCGNVGIILLVRLFRDMFAIGASTIDYGVGTQHYKERFASDFLLEAEVELHAPSWYGFLTNVINGASRSLNRSLVIILKRLGLLKLDPNWMAHRDIKSAKQLRAISRNRACGISRDGDAPSAQESRV